MGASTMGHQEMVDEIAKVRELTAKPFGVDLLTARPGQCEARSDDIIDGGARCSWPAWACPATWSSCVTTHDVARRSTCAARSATPSPRSRPGATSSSPRAPRPAATPGRSRRWRSCPRSSTRWATGCRSSPPAASFDGRGLAAALRARRRRRVGRHPLHRHARGPRPSPATRRRCSAPAEDGTVVSPGLHRQDVPGRAQRLHPGTSRTHPDELAAVPGAGGRSRCRTAPTTSAHDERTTEVDPDREFFPAGQGVGAIDELVPAGELVGQFVREAEAALDRAAGVRA